MGIGWLWIYTQSDNPDALAKENESRAFAIYTRWRAIVRRGTRLNTYVRDYYRKRVLRRTLLSLSDHQLQDIGMFRTGSDVRIEKSGRLTRPKKNAAGRGRPRNKSATKVKSESAVITEIDQFRKKPEPITYEPELNTKCG